GQACAKFAESAGAQKETANFIGDVCSKIADWLLDTAWGWLRGRQYRRPLYRVGMARRITGGAQALRPGEFLMTREALSTYNHKVRTTHAARYESGMEYHRREPGRVELAVKSQLLLTKSTANPTPIRVFDLPSHRCLAVPVTMGSTHMRDLDGQLRRTA